jgi:hypothetical protein
MMFDSSTRGRGNGTDASGKPDQEDEDDEMRWAEEEPDDDVGGWRLKVFMEDNEEEY